MIKDTFELRKAHGKFESVENDTVDSMRNHVANCQACGSDKPEKLHGVKSQDGLILLVGVTCAGILTSGKNPGVDSSLVGTGEIYKDGDKEVIYITQEWLKNLGDYLFQVGEHTNKFGDIVKSNFETNYNGAYHTVNFNPFLDSVYQQARKNNKISVKQYEAVNKAINK